MADVILVNPRYPYFDFSDELGIHQPLGLMQLGSHLIQNGISTGLIDANAEKIPNELVLHELPQHQAKIVLISVSTVLFPHAITIAKSIKENHPDIFVIAGGPHFMSMPHTLEGTPFDAAFGAPEADGIIVPFSKHILAEGKLDFSTPGLIFVKDSKLNRNPNPPLIQQPEMEKIPHPYKYAKEMGLKFNLYRGYTNSAIYGYGKYASVITSRGCVYKCTFCLEAEVFNRTYRYFPAKYVYEMLLDCEKLGAKEFYFMDSEWSTGRMRNMELMKMMIGGKKDWRWECLSRATDFQYNTIEYPRTMKKAGCFSVGIGVESGSDETLARIKKAATKDNYRTAFKILRECGIERRASFMMGYPWETEKDLDDTIKFAIELDPDFAYFQPLVPYMGTPLYEEAKSYLEVDAADDFGKWWQHSIVGGKVIMKTDTLSAEDITRVNADAYKKFYYRPSYVIRQLLRSWNKPQRLKSMSKNGIILLKQIMKRSKIKNGKVLMEDMPSPEVI